MGDVDGTIEVARGRLSEGRAEQLVRFWTRERALDEETARQRLADVVCVLLDGRDEVAGINSVFPADIELVGGRRFWVYRSYLPRAVAGAAQAMLRSAFAALEAEFDPYGDGPVGLCLLVGDRNEIAQRPEAEWSEPRLLYAGYLRDRRQVRIGYFKGARIAGGAPVPDRPLRPSGYRVEPFAEQRTVDAEAVIDLWTREGALRPDEARRRVREVLAVASDSSGRPVGVSTAYLQHCAQLGMDMWYSRVYVGKAHRRSMVATELARAGRDYLHERFTSGADTRAPGIVFEVESAALKTGDNRAHWTRTGFTFIGETEHGAHVRVHYFPGAVAPPPPY